MKASPSREKEITTKLPSHFRTPPIWDTRAFHFSPFQLQNSLNLIIIYNSKP